MLDKETLNNRKGPGGHPRLEDEAFVECLRRARDYVENDDLVECFEKVLKTDPD
ncbi:MAG: hypothetical protein V5A88_02710 [Candidatus Thermoplasmatota archaeon]